MTKVLVFDGVSQVAVQTLQDAGLEVVSSPQHQDRDFTDYPDIEAMILMMHPITAEIMDQLPNLKVIARFGVGYDNVDVQAASERGIVVTNTPGANATAVAETAITLMLMAGRFFASRQAQITDPAAKNYAQAHPGIQLSDKTVGILGFGHIGQKIAHMLTGFNAQVLVYARHDYPVVNGHMANLDEIFTTADYVVSALPGTAATQNLIDQAAFKKMKSTAVLVNVGRGSVVDEPALIQALKTGEIASAGLDVVAQEPIRADNELLSLPNAFVLPHVASVSQEALDEVGTLAAQNILQVLAGKTALNPVNEKG